MPTLREKTRKFQNREVKVGELFPLITDKESDPISLFWVDKQAHLISMFPEAPGFLQTQPCTN